MIKKRMIGLVLATATVLGAMALPAHAAGTTLSGNVTSFGSTSEQVTLSLYNLGGNLPIQETSLTKGGYAFSDLAAGKYVLHASKLGHVSREYDLTLSGDAVTQDVKLCVRGDVTEDGKINMGDTARAFSHVRKSSLLTDEYVLTCADMTKDGKLNIGDVSRIFSVVRNPGLLNPVIPPIPSDPVEDHKDEPVEMGGLLEFDAPVAAGHLVYYNLYKVSDTTLKIESPYAYVIYNGVTYEARDGVVTVPDLFSPDTNTPISLAIGNRDTNDQNFAVKLNYPLGHQMNPVTMPTSGNITTICEEGNDQGVYYLFTAAKKGTLTIRLAAQVDCNISITSLSENGGTRFVSLADNPGSTSLSFPLAEGESAMICISMNPVGFEYPAGTVSSIVRFR